MKRISTVLLLLFIGCIDYEFTTPGDNKPTITDTAVVTVDTEDTYQPPVAVCDVTPNPVAPPWENATWLGENSYDPAGETIVTYNWTLISYPAGSTSTMPLGAQNRLNFVPDMCLQYLQ